MLWNRWQQIAADVQGLDMLRPCHLKYMWSARPGRTCLRQKQLGDPPGPLLCMGSQRGKAKYFQLRSCIDVWSLKPLTPALRWPEANRELSR